MSRVQSGWFVLEVEVDRWPALSGWRGLQDRAVQLHFNHTFYAYDEAYGNDAVMMKNGLSLDYNIVYFGADAADALLKARLQMGLPTLCYLWSPHQLQPQFKLSRIQLRPFRSDAEFREGKTDYPIDVVEKLVSKSLAAIAPRVSQLVSRYSITNADQEEIMAAVDRGGLSAHEASCAWLLDAKNADSVLGWIPPAPVLSCEKSVAWVEGLLSNLPARSSESLHVRLRAVGTDGQPVSINDVAVLFDNTSVLVQWSRGSKLTEYATQVPPELTELAGAFELVVRVSNAWNETAGKRASCELLRLGITVKDEVSTAWILGGAGGASVLVVGGLSVFIRKRHAHLQAILLMLFTEVS